MPRFTVRTTKTFTVVCALIAASSFAPVDAASVSASPSNPALSEGVLDSWTDISVSIAAPQELQRGAALNATLQVSNRGSNVAQAVTCTVTTPRPDAVSGYSVARGTTALVEPVVGGESHWFMLGNIAAGATSITGLSGLTRVGSSTNGFTLGAFCFPLPVDRLHSNNLAIASVKLRD